LFHTLTGCRCDDEAYVHNKDFATGSGNGVPRGNSGPERRPSALVVADQVIRSFFQSFVHHANHFKHQPFMLWSCDFPSLLFNVPEKKTALGQTLQGAPKEEAVAASDGGATFSALLPVLPEDSGKSLPALLGASTHPAMRTAPMGMAQGMKIYI
jgi:hypothetical protein